MKNSISRLSPILGILACLATTCSSPAPVIINAQQVGDDVVFTGAGTLNLNGLSLAGTGGSALAGFRDDWYPPVLRMGSSSGFSTYAGPSLAIPSGFSNLEGIFAQPTFSSGQPFGTDYWFGQGGIQVPNGYVSGQLLSASMTYSQQTFHSLELNPGTYVWRWGLGVNVDSMSLNVIPEPTSGFLVGTGIMVFAVLRQIKRR
jgi:hypothetical protein